MMAPTQDGESQQQAVRVAAAMTSVFVHNLCVVILLGVVFLLLLCVGLVDCGLVGHPACGDRETDAAGGEQALTLSHPRRSLKRD